MRRAIAAEAARIISTQSQFNFRAAKQKAAENLGMSARSSLPSNAEIESALRDYQRFFGTQARIDHLRTMRKVACTVMSSLEAFSPRLAGPVLEGIADQHARIGLHVFSDPTDKIVMFFLDRGLPFSSEQRKLRWFDGSYRLVQLLITQVEGCEVELSLFNRVDLRQAPPCPIDGRPQKRASLSEVECLLTSNRD